MQGGMMADSAVRLTRLDDQAAKPVLAAQDKQLAELRKRYSGWQIWYVPYVGGHANWCARKLPRLSAESPDALARMIDEAGAA